MPARGSVYQLLDRDHTLGQFGFKTVYQANTVDAPAEERFLIIKFEAKSKQFGRVGPDRMTVWAHDKASQDYADIDRALERVKDLLADAVHLKGPDDWILTVADWNSDGPDLVDPGYDSITRWADFTVVSRYSSA